MPHVILLVRALWTINEVKSLDNLLGRLRFPLNGLRHIGRRRVLQILFARIGMVVLRQSISGGVLFFIRVVDLVLLWQGYWLLGEVLGDFVAGRRCHSVFGFVVS